MSEGQEPYKIGVGTIPCGHEAELAGLNAQLEALIGRLEEMLLAPPILIQGGDSALNRIAVLEAALRWYLADDERAVEQGILESVDLRPAKAALGEKGLKE